MPQSERIDTKSVLALVALVIAPTLALSLLGISSLNKAQAAFEKQIRDAYAKTAGAVIIKTLAEVDARFATVEGGIAPFALAPTPEARLAIAAQAPFVDGVTVLNQDGLVAYPAGVSFRQVKSGSPYRDERLEAALAVEMRESLEAAVARYEQLLNTPGIESGVLQGALAGEARCLAALGRIDEAVAAYGKLASTPPYGAAELSLPLLGRLRAWQLNPSDETRLEVLADCLSHAFDAPPDQINYCLSLAGGDDKASQELAAEAKQALAARAIDEALGRIALYLVSPDALSSVAIESPGTWRSVQLAGKWHLARTLALDTPDGRRLAVVVSANVESLAGSVVTPLLARESSGGPARFGLAFEQASGPAEGVGDNPEILSQRFPAPFEFWTLSVVSDGGGVSELARARMRLLSWAVMLAAVAAISGATGVLVWASRRARLARLQTDFVANVTHELKTPLTAIKSLAETMELNRVTAPERRAEFLSAIVREADRLSRLIGNVLDFSRLGQGPPRLRLEKSDLADLASGVVAAFRNSLPPDESGCVTLALPEEPVFSLVDAASIEGALFNLLDNAYKYSISPRRIEVLLAAADGRAVISVRDHGIGLTPAQQRKIWRKFYRVDTTLAAATQGAGLGLPLVKAYAEAHGGSAEVQSTPGEGSTFSIHLPLLVEGGA